jgi:hypothetical protein
VLLCRRVLLACRFLGTLSLEQLSRAAVLSWPFMFRPIWLAKQIHKLRQQELDGQQQGKQEQQQQQQEQQQQQQDARGAAG